MEYVMPFFHPPICWRKCTSSFQISKKEMIIIIITWYLARLSGCFLKNSQDLKNRSQYVTYIQVFCQLLGTDPVDPSLFGRCGPLSSIQLSTSQVCWHPKLHPCQGGLLDFHWASWGHFINLTALVYNTGFCHLTYSGWWWSNKLPKMDKKEELHCSQPELHYSQPKKISKEFPCNEN